MKNLLTFDMDFLVSRKEKNENKRKNEKKRKKHSIFHVYALSIFYLSSAFYKIKCTIGKLYWIMRNVIIEILVITA